MAIPGLILGTLYTLALHAANSAVVLRPLDGPQAQNTQE